jgi:putative sigma-54 modulation protein
MKRLFPVSLGPVFQTARRTESPAGTSAARFPLMAILRQSTEGKTMNKMNNSHEVIVTGIHLDLTPSLKHYVQEKMERVFRHDTHIVRIRVELECDRKHDHEHQFVAKAHVEVRGPNINCSAQSEEMHKSVDLLMDKIDHVLHKRHGQHKDKRNHPHPVEFDGVELPKAV